MSDIGIRDLHTLDECRGVVDLQVAVWGHDMETVPAGVLLVSAKRGGILIGAFDGDRLVGFVWSMPGWRDGRPTHWSHMLGVDPAARAKGLGAALKIAQRARALAQGVDLVEWTFDPLQAANAHLNFATLGVVASEYIVDAYGELTGPLHRGTPTDRLIAEWWIDRPHVGRRLAVRSGTVVARSAEVLDAPSVLDTRATGDWSAPVAEHLELDVRRVRIPVPADFGRLQLEATSLALEWRLAARRAFQAYFARGYRAVDFYLDRARGGGVYVLALPDEG
ncbi:MAG TPA: GNAT family N-acetyltransferase [Vicinamibacterales bacterium]|nr:GNAT family N-acetyltransferase [Vicinamibacterales bacterium]